MRHVVLFEPDPSGHRMVFVRYIVEAMARHGGVRATLVTSKVGAATPWARAIQTDQEYHLSLLVAEEPRSTGGFLPLPRILARQFSHARLLKAAMRKLEKKEAVDYVFIPFVDDYVLFPFALRRDWLGGRPWGGIAIRPRFHLRNIGAVVPPRWEDRIEAFGYHHLLRDRSLDVLFSIDPYLSSVILDPRVATVCDPSDITDEAPDRAWLPVAEDAVVLLVYGHIDERKAIDRLLRIVGDPRAPRSLVVALVGMQDAAMAPLMQSPMVQDLRARGKLVEVPRHVSDREEASAFARADIVWGYYPNSYCSSGAMVRAGRMGRPLMATREGLVGLLTQKSASGLTAPEDNDDALLSQLLRMTQDATLRAALGEGGRRYFAGATGKEFGNQIVGRLAQVPHNPKSQRA